MPLTPLPSFFLSKLKKFKQSKTSLRFLSLSGEGFNSEMRRGENGDLQVHNFGRNGPWPRSLSPSRPVVALHGDIRRFLGESVTMLDQRPIPQHQTATPAIPVPQPGHASRRTPPETHAQQATPRAPLGPHPLGPQAFIVPLPSPPSWRQQRAPVIDHPARVPAAGAGSHHTPAGSGGRGAGPGHASSNGGNGPANAAYGAWLFDMLSGCGRHRGHALPLDDQCDNPVCRCTTGCRNCRSCRDLVERNQEVRQVRDYQLGRGQRGRLGVGGEKSICCGEVHFRGGP